MSQLQKKNEDFQGENIVRIIIVGCGKVGETLAAELSQEGDDITVIDRKEDKVERLCNAYDIMGCTGNGAGYSTQLEAGIKEADLLIAVTGSDELNLLCCLLARKAGNCQTIARVRTPEYSSELRYLKEELGLAMVLNQELATAMELARVLKFPSAIDIDTFAKGRVDLLRFRIPADSPLDQMTLNEMHSRLKSNVLVVHPGTRRRDSDSHRRQQDGGGGRNFHCGRLPGGNPVFPEDRTSGPIR